MIKSLIKTVSQSVWIASALIGIASILFYTKVPTIIAIVIQLIVCITAFTIVAIMNHWITMTITDILLYAGATLAIMIIIQLIYYLVSLNDSKQINQRLEEK